MLPRKVSLRIRVLLARSWRYGLLPLSKGEYSFLYFLGTRFSLYKLFLCWKWFIFTTKSFIPGILFPRRNRSPWKNAMNRTLAFPHAVFHCPCLAPVPKITLMSQKGTTQKTEGTLPSMCILFCFFVPHLWRVCACVRVFMCMCMCLFVCLLCVSVSERASKYGMCGISCVCARAFVRACV